MTQETAEDHQMTQETAEDHQMTQETAEDHQMTQETTEGHHMDKDMTPETEVRMARVEETTSEIVTIEIGMAGMVEDHLIHHKDTTFETAEDHHMDKVTIEGTIAAINQICAVMHPNDKGSEYLMTDAMICTVT